MPTNLSDEATEIIKLFEKDQPKINQFSEEVDFYERPNKSTF